MGLSGLVGAGAQQGLEAVLERRLQELMRQQQETQHADQLALQTRQVEGVEADRTANRENQRRTIDLNELKRRDDSNQQGLELMQADKAQMGQDAALAGLPPRLRQIANLRKVGVTGISPQDLNTPEETAAAQSTKTEGDFAEWKKKQDYNENQIRTRPKEGAGAPKPPAKLPVGMATTIAAAKTSLAGLDRLESLYSDDKVGPVAGRYNKAERAAPSLIGGMMPDAPENFEEFAAESATLKNQVIQAITGAAVGVKEQERIMAQIPDVTNNPSTWKARAKATRRNLTELSANQTQMGTGASEAAPGATVDADAPSAEIRYERDPKTGKLVRVGG